MRHLCKEVIEKSPRLLRCVVKHIKIPGLSKMKRVSDLHGVNGVDGFFATWRKNQSERALRARLWRFMGCPEQQCHHRQAFLCSSRSHPVCHAHDQDASPPTLSSTLCKQEFSVFKLRAHKLLQTCKPPRTQTVPLQTTKQFQRFVFKADLSFCVAVVLLLCLLASVVARMITVTGADLHMQQ